MESENRVATPWLDVVMELAIRYNKKKPTEKTRLDNLVWRVGEVAQGPDKTLSCRENLRS